MTRRHPALLSNNISFCHHKISFFYFKIFFEEPKLANALNYFSQIGSILLYLSVIPYLKNPVQRSARNKVYRVSLMILLLLLLILTVIPLEIIQLTFNTLVTHRSSS